ncbi:MAG: DUF92 domain-containing protein [Thermomicrobium sp.]|nr:DUF92 domain-containing protein [Thermomicrobium sp.]
MRAGTPSRSAVHRFLVGSSLAVAIALLAVRVRALDRGGALAAATIGTTVFAAGGLAWAVPMVGFFAAASALTRLGRRRKRGLVDQHASRPRTAGQVLANGGVAAVVALLQLSRQSRRTFRLPYLGALAAASADTWATELGVLSPSPPRSLRTGRPVPPGTSGAVSPLGTLAMLAGASLVARLAPRHVPRLPVFLAGLAGAFVDSLLGATLQARYYCPRCQRILETARHACPQRACRISGLPGLTNDTVNALATLTGALVAAVLAAFYENSRRSASASS